MGRCVGYRDNGYLILNKNEITISTLIEWFIYHSNDYVYVEDGGKVVGIIDGKHFLKKFKEENYLIEQKFIFIDSIEVDRCLIYDMFDLNSKLTHLPIISEGILLGEYYDSFQIKEEAERYHIRCMVPELQAFNRQIGEYFIEQHIDTVCVMIDKNDSYTKGILTKISGVDWKFYHSYEQWSVQNANTIYLDMKYPKEYREYLNVSNIKVITIFQIMGRILLRMFSIYCKQNEILLLACYAVSKKDISFFSPQDSHKMSSDSDLNDILGDIDYLKKFYRKNPGFAYATSKNVGPLGGRNIRHNGLYNHLLDCKNEFITINKGIRRTTNEPQSWKQEVHMFGPCIVQGICVTDRYTIESYLQRILNRKSKNFWKVWNHGAASHTADSSFCNDILTAMDTVLHNGDMVILLDAFTEETLEWLKEENIKVIRDNTLFDGSKDYFMNNTYHCNHLANQKYARLLSMEIQKKFKIDERIEHRFFLEKNMDLSFCDDAYLHNPELLSYVKKIKEECKIIDIQNKKIAAICTHANPFTRGHYYLVSKAASEMDYVYVFVVQDSLNALPFLDRMDIIQHAVKEFTNVKVVSCGMFMISFRTFPDYFTTAKYNNEFNLNNVKTDTRIFASVFCKELGIKYRYLGEEPSDYYTKQLNEYYIESLPQFGVHPVIIERKKYNDKPISASLVRKLIQEDRFEEAEYYAHPYTVNLLRHYYNHITKKSIKVSK